MNSPVKIFQTVDEAYPFLQELGAPSQLLLHVKLVGEAAERLIAKLNDLQVQFDAGFVRLGVAFHDVGKILHPQELLAKGNSHEAAGELLLITHGIEPQLARCCRSHSQWQTMDCSFEELCVALADKLWKGSRMAELEERVIQNLAAQCHKDYWVLFVEMDACFESIAAEGDSRLLRSQAL
jgi:HD domain